MLQAGAFSDYKAGDSDRAAAASDGAAEEKGGQEESPAPPSSGQSGGGYPPYTSLEMPALSPTMSAGM